MKTMRQIYRMLLKAYGPQGWWPIKGEYHKGDYTLPETDRQRFEIILGAILTQYRYFGYP